MNASLHSDVALPAGPPPRLLLVEDDLDTAELIRECLEDHFSEGCVRSVFRLEEAREVDPEDFDLVLSDMNLPDGSGLELLDEMLAKREDLPIVFVTGEGILENAIAAIRGGAYDYVVKAGDYLFAIPLVVEKNLELWKTKRDNIRLHEELESRIAEIDEKNRQLEEAVKQLETVAATDPLTGLFNRRAFQRTMEQSFAEAVRHDHDTSCLMLDLDGFKQLNDAFGHQYGDRILIVAAKVLSAHSRRSDTAGRFGGDEFIVVMPQTDLDTAKSVAERVLQQFEADARAALSDVAYRGAVSMSMGLASLAHTQASNPEALIAAADHALYAAKAAGKGHIQTYRKPHAAAAQTP
jgi:diguanylate cyclase (GGDEF)-like protein